MGDMEQYEMQCLQQEAWMDAEDDMQRFYEEVAQSVLGEELYAHYVRYGKDITTLVEMHGIDVNHSGMYLSCTVPYHRANQCKGCLAGVWNDCICNVPF